MFNNNLMKTKRLSLKLTQQELGKLTGITQPEISEFERGIKNPGKIRRKRIADALGCPELTVEIYTANRQCPSCGHSLI